MKLLCVATESSSYYEILVESCKKYNYELITLGWGQKWQGLTWKHQLYSEYLNTLSNDNEIVILSDGYDVICLRDSKDTKDIFLSFKKNIVFGNQTSLATKIGFDTYSENIMCSGSIIGYVRQLKKLENMFLKSGLIEIYNRGDQFLLNELKKRKEYRPFFIENTTIDENFKLFYVTDLSTMFHPMYILNNYIGLSFDNKKGLYKVDTTNEYPPILHAAGYVNINNIVKKLGYSEDKIKNGNNGFKINQMINMFKNLFKNNIYYKIVPIILFFVYNIFR